MSVPRNEVSRANTRVHLGIMRARVTLDQTHSRSPYEGISSISSHCQRNDTMVPGKDFSQDVGGQGRGRNTQQFVTCHPVVLIIGHALCLAHSVISLRP